MATPSRFDKIGLSGKKGQVSSEGLAVNVGDWATQTIAFKPELVASTAQQNTGIFFPPGAAVFGFINVITPATGTTTEISCGASSAPTGLFDGVDVSTAGIKLANGIDPTSLGEEVEYSFGSADLTGLDCEIVFMVIGQNAQEVTYAP